jgi:hypothetical protein
VSLLVVAVVAAQEPVLLLTRALLIGVAGVEAVRVTTVDQVVGAVAPVVRAAVVLAVAAVALLRRAAREAGEVLLEVVVAPLAAQTPALEAPAALRATTSSAIRL